jgi:hypothetical protein
MILHPPEGEDGKRWRAKFTVSIKVFFEFLSFSDWVLLCNVVGLNFVLLLPHFP